MPGFLRLRTAAPSPCDPLSGRLVGLALLPPYVWRRAFKPMDACICVGVKSLMNAPQSLVRDLVEWIATGPRPYADVMARWRTSCPRLPVWEDAMDAGLIRHEAGEQGSFVIATDKGHRWLAETR